MLFLDTILCMKIDGNKHNPCPFQLSFDALFMKMRSDLAENMITDAKDEISNMQKMRQVNAKLFFTTFGLSLVGQGTRFISRRIGIPRSAVPSWISK